MKKIIEAIKKLSDSVKIYKETSTKVEASLQCEMESNYGNLGYITIEVTKKDDGKYVLEMIEITPMGRRHCICSYGQRYVTANGYISGKDETLEENQVISKILNQVKKYRVK